MTVCINHTERNNCITTQSWGHSLQLIWHKNILVKQPSWHQATQKVPTPTRHVRLKETHTQNQCCLSTYPWTWNNSHNHKMHHSNQCKKSVFLSNIFAENKLTNTYAAVCQNKYVNGDVITIIMILFLKRFSMLNMLNCAVQCQWTTHTYTRARQKHLTKEQ